MFLRGGLGGGGQGRTLRYRGYTLFRKPGNGGADRPQRDLDPGSGNSTQIQVIALDTDLAEMDVASGIARFYNKSADTVIKATSPFGYVLGDPARVFDFYVGENSVEVVAIQGNVSFVHSATEAKYDVALDPVDPR